MENLNNILDITYKLAEPYLTQSRKAAKKG